jgi:hypothetical protein
MAGVVGGRETEENKTTKVGKFKRRINSNNWMYKSFWIPLTITERLTESFRDQGMRETARQESVYYSFSRKKDLECHIVVVVSIYFDHVCMCSLYSPTIFPQTMEVSFYE